MLAGIIEGIISMQSSINTFLHLFITSSALLQNSAADVKINVEEVVEQW